MPREKISEQMWIVVEEKEQEGTLISLQVLVAT